MISFFLPEYIFYASSPEHILIFQIIAFLIIAIIIFRKILFYRCNVCKKWFSMVKCSSARVGGIQEQYYTDDAINKRTGIRDIHEIMYRCKYCRFVKNKAKYSKLRKG